MKSEIFITKKPKSELLMKFISYYYFHSSEKVDVNIKFHYLLLGFLITCELEFRNIKINKIYYEKSF